MAAKAIVSNIATESNDRPNRTLKRLWLQKFINNFMLMYVCFFSIIPLVIYFKSLDSQLELELGLEPAPSLLLTNQTMKPISKPYAVAVYLRGDKKKYFAGTVAIMESVRSQKGIDTVVVCHESVPNTTRSMLKLMGHEVFVVEDVEFDASSIPSNHFKILIQKYVVFNLIQYENILFVDADTMIMKPENLPTIFSMLDRPKTAQELVPIGWSFIKNKNRTFFSEQNYTAKQLGHESQRGTIYMGLDYGRDNFNSGVILYKPQAHMFEDFQQFLKDTILSMSKKDRGVMVRSTQRLVTEFFLMPWTNYDLYSFCPGEQPFKCRRNGCYCRVHIYPSTLDCNKTADKELFFNATIAHFAAGMIDYEALCDKRSADAVNVAIRNYIDRVRGEMEEKKNYVMDCQIPMIRSIRDLYFQAIDRVGI